MDEKSLHHYLKANHTGRKNAALSKELEAVFSCKGAEIRRCINALRTDGVPICSCAEGYFYSEDETDIAQTVNQLHGRVRMIENAQHGMTKALSKEG